MSKTARAFALVAITIAVASCSRGLRIDIAGSWPRPSFRFSASSLLEFEKPIIDSFGIYEFAGGVEKPVWVVAGSSSCEAPRPAPVVLINYGSAPAGWNVVTPPRPLRPNVTYAARASGCGFRGELAFKLRNGAILSKPGYGGAPVGEVEAM